jgi:hypothetical protein
MAPLPARACIGRGELESTLTYAIELTGLRCGAAYSLCDEDLPTLHTHTGFPQVAGLSEFFGHSRLLAEALATADGRIMRLRMASADEHRTRAVLARAGVSLMVLVPVHVPDHPRAVLVLGAPRVSARWQLGGPTHTQRVSRYCRLLARLSGLPEAYCELVGQAGALHDVGKLAVPEAVLSKPGALTASERHRVEQHAQDGRAILAGAPHPLTDLAALVAWTHHERWDGLGYPRGLRGEQIPLEGRIAAIADVYDALTSDRPYRPAMTAAEALAIMRAGEGSHFDPHLLGLFADALPRLQSLRQRVLAPHAVRLTLAPAAMARPVEVGAPA